MHPNVLDSNNLSERRQAAANSQDTSTYCSPPVELAWPQRMLEQQPSSRLLLHPSCERTQLQVTRKPTYRSCRANMMHAGKFLKESRRQLLPNYTIFHNLIRTPKLQSFCFARCTGNIILRFHGCRAGCQTKPLTNDFVFDWFYFTYYT